MHFESHRFWSFSFCIKTGIFTVSGINNKLINLTINTSTCMYTDTVQNHGFFCTKHILSPIPHTYCNKGYSFKMVISEDPWHSHPLPSVWQWNCHYLFLRLRSVATVIRPPNLLLAGGRTLESLRHRRG